MLKDIFRNLTEPYQVKKIAEGLFLILAFFSASFICYITQFDENILSITDSNSISSYTFLMALYYCISHAIVSILVAIQNSFNIIKVPRIKVKTYKRPYFIAGLGKFLEWSFNRLNSGVFFNYGTLVKLPFTITIFLTLYIGATGMFYTLGIMLLLCILLTLAHFINYIFRTQVNTQNSPITIEDDDSIDIKEGDESLKSKTLSTIISSIGILAVALALLIGYHRASYVSESSSFDNKDFGPSTVIINTSSGVILRSQTTKRIYFLSWNDLSKSSFTVDKPNSVNPMPLKLLEKIQQ